MGMFLIALKIIVSVVTLTILYLISFNRVFMDVLTTNRSLDICTLTADYII